MNSVVPPSRSLALTFVLLSSVSLFCCKSEDSSSTSEKKASPSAGEPEEKPPAPELAARTERLVMCTMVGDGTARLESRSEQAIASVQLWFYKYESETHESEEVGDTKPTSRRGKKLTADLAPKTSKAIAHELGPQTNTECEVSSVVFKDGGHWSNANLLYPTAAARPKGGETDADLAKRSEAVVVATWEKNRSGAPKVLFHNMSSRPLTLGQLSVVFVDANGATIQKMAVHSALQLGPNESTVGAIAVPEDRVPKQTIGIEISVARLRFGDGKREELVNLN